MSSVGLRDVNDGGALTAVNTAAVRAREALSRISGYAHPDELGTRLGAAASAIGQLAFAVPDAMRFQAVTPLRVPPIPTHVPDFLRTRPEPEVEALDAAAEAAAAALGDRSHDVVAYNASCRRLVDSVAATSSDAMRAMHAANEKALAGIGITDARRT